MEEKIKCSNTKRKVEVFKKKQALMAFSDVYVFNWSYEDFVYKEKTKPGCSFRQSLVAHFAK